MSSVLDAIKKTDIPDIYAIQRVLGSEEDQDELFDLAYATKERIFGRRVEVRGIIELSNYCTRDCAYCGINMNAEKADRYRMTADEIVEAAVNAGKVYKTVILNGCHDAAFTSEKLVDIVAAIREKTDAAITMAAGQRTPEAYQAMRKAGASRFLVTYETVQGLLREKRNGSLVSSMDDLGPLGFIICGGCIVGLPGQNDSVVAADILLMRERDVDLAGFSPFIPHPDTIVSQFPAGSPQTTLRALAVARVILQNCDLPATAALILKSGLKKAILCGASSILQDATPLKYRKLYDPYPGRADKDETLEEQRSAVDAILTQLKMESV